MTSSTRLRTSPRAERDVETVLRYTLGTWGEEQRILYDALLWDAFRRIQAFPEIGKVADEARPNLREYHLEHHLILYRREPDAVTILRVINPRRLARPAASPVAARPEPMQVCVEPRPSLNSRT